MKTISFFLGTTAIIIACNSNKNRDEPDGGFCSYTATNYPVIITFIDTAEIGMTNVWCAVSHPQQDTVDYYHSNNQYADLSILRQEKLNIGDTIYYEHRQIKEGACNPDMSGFCSNWNRIKINNRGIFKAQATSGTRPASWL